MKSKMSTGRIFIILLGFLFLISCSEETRNEVAGSGVVNPVSTDYTLTQQEQEDLQHLAEEEKLARDVYLYAYERYSLKIFSNISNSEQRHMDRVKGLIEEFGLEDNSSTVIGEFNNKELQTIYDQLIEQVEQSLVSALLVGATIEDLDINDIEEFESRTQNEEMLAMYSSLKCGSRNHLRAYYAQIVQNGSTYQPVYISQELFASIVSSEQERCQDQQNGSKVKRRWKQN